MRCAALFLEKKNLYSLEWEGRGLEGVVLEGTNGADSLALNLAQTYVVEECSVCVCVCGKRGRRGGRGRPRNNGKERGLMFAPILAFYDIFWIIYTYFYLCLNAIRNVLLYINYLIDFV